MRVLCSLPSSFHRSSSAISTAQHFGSNLLSSANAQVLPDDALGVPTSPWTSNGNCRVDSGYFKPQSASNGPIICTMNQTIDVTFARNYLIGPLGGSVRITLTSAIKFMSYTLENATVSFDQLACGGTRNTAIASLVSPQLTNSF